MSESTSFHKILNQLTIGKEQIYANVDEIKNIRDEFENMFLIDTAQFFTDKIATLESSQQDDQREVYKMAKLLHEKEQYHRAALMLTTKNLHQTDLSCRYLAAKCYFDCKEYLKSMSILNLPTEQANKVDQPSNGSIQNNSSLPLVLTFDEKAGTLNQWKSSLELLKGYLYEATNRKEMANKCFLDALELDHFCYEALQALVKFDMISKEQVSHLSELLSPNDGDPNPTANVLKELYRFQFSSNLESADKLSPIMKSLRNSNDMLLIEAEKLYQDCHFKKSYAILTEVYAKDILDPKCLFLMIGCLLEMRNEIVLQKLSHQLVETIPESPIAWYAVGCYYYLTSNMDNARKYFSKSNSIDPDFQASMLIYGHSFEMEALHDQAIAVYLDLSKVMANSYLPKLYVGVEYGHLNNSTMAEKYLYQALELSDDNIFVLHELGIVYYQKKHYEMAKTYFQKVYSILSEKKFLMEYPEKWEPLMNNIGHVHRKLGNYDEAIFYYKIALRMLPDNSSTLDALGLVFSLKGDLQMACDYFQKALSLKRDDAFALTMYNLVFQQFNQVDNGHQANG